MALSRSILKNFAKVTNDRAAKTNTNTYVYATAVVGEDGTKYVKMDGSEQVTPVSRATDIEDGDRVMVTVQDHRAIVMGNLTYPPSGYVAELALEKANDGFVTIEKLQGDMLKYEVGLLDYIKGSELDYEVGRIGYLKGEQLEYEIGLLDYIKGDELDYKVGSIGYLKGTQLEYEIGLLDYIKGDELEYELGSIGYLKGEELDYKYAKIVDLEATNATVENLKAKDAEIENALVDYAKIDYLEANYATIETLEADYATITQLNAAEANIGAMFAGYAKITDLDAAKADIDVLEGNYANIETLLSGNVSSGSIQSIVLNSSNAVIANGMIKSAMIESLTFDKITGFDINTTNLTIHSEDGKSKWSDNTIQISDANRVRVQIGKDASDDYSMSVWDASGNLIWDALGATENTIQRKIIRNDVVADDAAIAGSKLDIASVVTEINGATTKLKSTTILLDEKNQTLDMAFSSMETTVANNLTEAKAYVDGEIDGLEIGGRNLIRNSNFANEKTYWATALAPDSSATVVADDVYGQYLQFIVGAVGTIYSRIYVNTKNVWEAGQVYSYSFMAKASAAGVTIRPSRSLGDFGETHTLTTEWVKYTGTIACTDTVEGGTLSFTCDSGTATYYITNVKLEKGTKATEWTPAPEDTQNQIDELTTVTQTHSTNISVMQGQISSLISKDTAIETALGERVLTSEYNSTVATVNSLTTTIGEHTTQLNTQSGQISSVSSRVTTVEQNLDSFSVTLTETKAELDGLEIGGRNLILDSETFEHTRTDTSYSYLGGFPHLYNSDYGISLINDGGEFTLSFDYEVTGVTTECSIRPCLSYSLTSYRTIGMEVPLSIGDNKGHAEHMFIPDSEQMQYGIRWMISGFLVGQNASAIIVLKNIKLEKGNKATSWTPAPEDTDSTISALTTRVSTNETSITALQGEISLKVSQTEVDNAVNSIEIGGRNFIKDSDFEWTATKDTTAVQSNSFGIYDVSSLVGKTVTFSYYQHTPGSRNTDLNSNTGISNRCGMHLTVRWSDSTGTNSGTKIDYPCTNYLSSTTINKRVTKTFTLTPPTGYDTLDGISVSAQITAIPGADNSETWRLGHPKLELGTKATDWTPAPEDIDSAISDVDAKFTNYSTTTQMTSAIELSKTSILSTVSETYTTIEQRDADQQALESYKSEVSLKLEKDSIVSTVGDYYATLEDINVGGRNLLIRSTASKGYLSSDGTGGFNSSSSVWDLTSDWIDVSDYDSIVISLYDSFEISGTGIGRYCLYDSNKTCINTTTFNPRTPTSVVVDTSNATYFRITALCFDTYRYKVEKGNIATDWTPAPEDTIEYIASVETIATQTKDRFSWLVKSPDSATDTTFELTDRVASLTAEYINLNGLVTFSGLDSTAQTKINTAQSTADTAKTNAANAQSTANVAKTGVSTLTTNLATAGKTTINGANITTGTIDADRIDVDGLFAKTITATGTITGVTLEGVTISVKQKLNLTVNNVTKTVMQSDSFNDAFYVGLTNSSNAWMLPSDSSYIWFSAPSDGSDTGIGLVSEKVTISGSLSVTGDTVSLTNVLMDSAETLGDLTAYGTIYEGGTALSSKYAAASHSHDTYIYGTTYSGVSELADANTAWKSGFYDYASGSNYPTNDTWYWLIYAGHRSNSENYRYGFQIAAANGTSNFHMRTTSQSGTGTWRKLLHDGNYSSYCVPYSSGVGSVSAGISFGTAGAYIYQENSDGNIHFRWRNTSGGSYCYTSLATIFADLYNHTHSYLPLSGGTLNGDLTLSVSSASGRRYILTNSIGSIDFRIAADGNAGIYSTTKSTWLIWHRFSDNACMLPMKTYVNYLRSYSGTVGIDMDQAAFKPSANNSYQLGSSNQKWTYVYATNGTIQTSDENEKDIISGVTESYENLFMDFNPILYRWRNLGDGIQHDRIHCGLGAQSVLASAQKHGLDSMTFAAICYDELDEPTIDGRTKVYGLNYGELHGLEIHMIQKNYRNITELQNGVVALNLTADRMEAAVVALNLTVSEQNQSIEQLKHQYLSQEERLQYVIQQLEQAQAEIGQLQTQLKALA